MKFICVFAAVLFITVVGAVFQCPVSKKGSGVNCFVNPCLTSTNTCKAAGQICCANYSTGCNVDCHQCPATSGSNCFVDPCQFNSCTASQTCCSDYSDCSAKCY